ncbi:hypothetical protein CXG81DRAFT_11712, partial [Caulochytrium protostelioides]
MTKLLKTSQDAQLEKRLLQLDELQRVNRYKFGVLYVQHGQTAEDAWFGNHDVVSPAWDAFLAVLGDRVALKGYAGSYAAGLDTKNGQTGTDGLHTTWRDNDVMFHVSTFLPYSATDPQQIQRKRHIGNDIVCLVFLDAIATWPDGPGGFADADVVNNAIVPFDPALIASQFLHVFLVVQPVVLQSTGRHGWRVMVTRLEAVPAFGPPLPDPPVFTDPAALHHFLLAKMVNGENAAYHSPRFRKPQTRTRNTLLDDILTRY